MSASRARNALKNLTQKDFLCLELASSLQRPQIYRGQRQSLVCDCHRCTSEDLVRADARQVFCSDGSARAMLFVWTESEVRLRSIIQLFTCAVLLTLGKNGSTPPNFSVQCLPNNFSLFSSITACNSSPLPSTLAGRT